MPTKVADQVIGSFLVKKKVQDVQSQEVTPEEQVVDPEFSPEEDTDIETNPSDRIPVNSKKYNWRSIICR